MSAGRRDKLTPEQIAAALTADPLLGTKAAATIIGVPPTNLRRDYGDQLTTVRVDGTGPAYFCSEVRRIADERAAVLAERRSRRRTPASA